MVTVSNLTYAKIKCKTSNSMGNPYVSYIYKRTNSKGHLVTISSYFIDIKPDMVTEANEMVLHPGNDNSYKFTEQFLPYGVVNTKMEREILRQVEGVNFMVKPYNGTLVPLPAYSNLNDLSKKVTENEYAFGVGKIRSYCHAIERSYNYEERLTSYKLN